MILFCLGTLNLFLLTMQSRLVNNARFPLHMVLPAAFVVSVLQAFVIQRIAVTHELWPVLEYSLGTVLGTGAAQLLTSHLLRSKK